MLVDFWGTWCEPCVQDVPTTERLYRTLLDAGAKAALLTIAVEDTVKEVRAFMRARQLTFPVLMANADVVDRFKVPHYPYRLVVYLPTGTSWSYPTALTGRARSRAC